ncbi:hypothetical protein [Mesorhizobium sp. M1403]|uniref:hypothetical protein n=1 Tax=Mesorhizobium sp. M1403 TaxID=2957097 RepID=UPI0033397E62
MALKPKNKKTALRRVLGANQHHTQIGSIAAGTKQEQNVALSAKTANSLHPFPSYPLAEIALKAACPGTFKVELSAGSRWCRHRELVISG